MFKKRRFDSYVSSQPLMAHNAYGNEYSIQLDLQEVQSRGFSSILGKYVNDKRAVIEDGQAYIVPEYDRYQLKSQNYRMQKLLQYVNEKNYITMINESSIVVKKFVNEEKSQYYFAVCQDKVQKYKCMVIVALLIDAGLARVEESDNTVYIAYNYLHRLEKRTKIQKDLSGFRILLGESSNLGNLLDLVEKGNFKNGELYVLMNDVQEYDFVLEMLSLVDAGLVECVVYNGEEAFKIDETFGSWLLEHISNTSDRISFGDLFIT